MTYIQWRDELDECLRSLPVEEREKVFSYFSEMYADKRDAGLSEREIISEFGAPYDVARRILNENKVYDEDENFFETEDEPAPLTRAERRKYRREERKERAAKTNTEPTPSADGQNARGEGTLLVVLLCLVIWFPLFFGLATAAFLITVGFIAAPIALIGSGLCMIVSSIGGMIAGGATAYLYMLGAGVLTLGVGVFLAPLFFYALKQIFKLLGKLFSQVNALIRGRRVSNR